MSTTYQSVGQAIYDLINGIDISAVVATGWAKKSANPLKEWTGYPVFFIQEAEDSEDALDSLHDDDRVGFWVYIIDTFEDASDASDRLRKLVDLIRTRVRQERRSATPLGNAAYSLDLAGSWGSDINRGERYYRLTITARVAQPLT